MALETRSENILLIVIGQSNESREQPQMGRPILASAAGSAGQSVYTIGAGHGFNTTSEVSLVKPSGLNSFIKDQPVIAYTTDSITVADTTNPPLNHTLFNANGGMVQGDMIAHSTIGCPNSGTGMWTYLSEQMWINNKQWVQTVDSFGIGGTSFITDWCGSTGSADSRTVLASGDAGFDPNSYLTNLKNNLESWANSFDRCIVVIQHGQADAEFNSGVYTSTSATTGAIQKGYYKQAVRNIYDWAVANIAPDQVYIGSSQVGGTGSATDDQAGFTAVIEPAMEAVVSETSALQGPMLSTLLLQGTQHNYRDGHLNEYGQIECGRLWADVLAPGSGAGTPRANVYIPLTTEAATSSVFTLQPGQSVEIFSAPRLGDDEFILAEVLGSSGAYNSLGILIDQRFTSNVLRNKKTYPRSFRLSKTVTQSSVRVESN
jgi:hypothetical protein